MLTGTISIFWIYEDDAFHGILYSPISPLLIKLQRIKPTVVSPMISFSLWRSFRFRMDTRDTHWSSVHASVCHPYVCVRIFMCTANDENVIHREAGKPHSVYHTQCTLGRAERTRRENCGLAFSLTRSSNWSRVRGVWPASVTASAWYSSRCRFPDDAR